MSPPGPSTGGASTDRPITGGILCGTSGSPSVPAGLTPERVTVVAAAADHELREEPRSHARAWALVQAAGTATDAMTSMIRSLLRTFLIAFELPSPGGTTKNETRRMVGETMRGCVCLEGDLPFRLGEYRPAPKQRQQCFWRARARLAG